MSFYPKFHIIMKKILLSILVFISVSPFTFGQNYHFQVMTGIPYTNLTGATNLTQGQIWDDPELTVPIGFEFPFWWNHFDTLYLGDGWCALNEASDTVLIPYSMDMVDRGSLGTTSLSSINAKTETVAGEKILKIEYNNVGFWEEMDQLGTLNWYTNVQLWIRQSGIFEIHIGPTNVGQPTVAFSGESGPGIGYGEPMNSYWLTGQASAPTLTQFTNMNIGSLSSVPVEGTEYFFQPYVNSVPKPSLNLFSIGPNPVLQTLHLTLPEPGTLSVYDLTGKMMTEKRYAESGNASMEVGTLPSGIYLASYVTDSGERTTRRMIKQ
jgi:hypothetical protein